MFTDTESEFDAGELSSNEFFTLFTKFISRKYTSNLEHVLLQSSENGHYSLEIAWPDLVCEEPELCKAILDKPLLCIPLVEQAISLVQRSILDTRDVETPEHHMVFKANVHARFYDILGPRPEKHYTVRVPRSKHTGQLVQMSGTVIRAGSMRVLEWSRTLECSKCHHRFVVHVDLEQLGNKFCKVLRCPVRSDKPCAGRSFRAIDSETVCKDYQEIKLQEPMRTLDVGTIPRSSIVVLQDDLVDSCQPGDDVVVVGVVLQRWRAPIESDRCEIEVFVLANHLFVKNQKESNPEATEALRARFVDFWQRYRERPLAGRDVIVRSVAPLIFGMALVKMAVMLSVIGGVARTTRAGMKIRGEPHLLLVGDPGTGKSQFLKYATKLASRSVLTSGTGSTNAGLTVTAVRDATGEWTLEAGALVLSDGGVCCIDEFSTIRPQDRTTIHEAMEQQTLSVAKAGLVCKLNTRASVIAATNPKGAFEKGESISVNTAISSPLLSRFDLVFVLLDEVNRAWDTQVSSFILSGASAPKQEAAELSLADLKSYIQVVKTLNPTLSNEASMVLKAYYRKQRRSDISNQARTTIRLLQSSVRIAQAHARLMFREEVTLVDAVMTVVLMESSVESTALLGVSSPLHTTFCDDPDAQYLDLEYSVLRGLDLDYLSTRLSQSRPPPPPSSFSSSSSQQPRFAAPHLSYDHDNQLLDDEFDEGEPEDDANHIFQPSPNVVLSQATSSSSSIDTTAPAGTSSRSDDVHLPATPLPAAPAPAAAATARPSQPPRPPAPPPPQQQSRFNPPQQQQHNIHAPALSSPPHSPTYFVPPEISSRWEAFQGAELGAPLSPEVPPTPLNTEHLGRNLEEQIRKHLEQQQHHQQQPQRQHAPSEEIADPDEHIEWPEELLDASDRARVTTTAVGARSTRTTRPMRLHVQQSWIDTDDDVIPEFDRQPAPPRNATNKRSHSDAIESSQPSHTATKRQRTITDFVPSATPPSLLMNNLPTSQTACEINLLTPGSSQPLPTPPAVVLPPPAARRNGRRRFILDGGDDEIDG